MASIVIFYATGSKQIRGILVPDSDEELQRLNPKPSFGESILTVPAFSSPQKGIFDPANNQYVIDCVTQATGVVPPDPSCAVINDLGMVEAIIAADEAIDTLPNKTLIQKYHPEITQGCVYDAKTKLFTVPAQDIPAMVDKQGQVIDAKQIPAKTLIREVKADGIILQD